MKGAGFGQARERACPSWQWSGVDIYPIFVQVCLCILDIHNHLVAEMREPNTNDFYHSTCELDLTFGKVTMWRSWVNGDGMVGHAVVQAASLVDFKLNDV